MRKITHMFFALAIAVWFLRSMQVYFNVNLQLYYAFMVIAVLSSTLPDLDLRLKHRRTLHNITIPLIVVLTIYAIVPQVVVFGIAFLIGWVSHVLLDAITIKGVCPFYPLLDFKLALKLCKSESVIWNILVLMLSLLAIAVFYVK